MPWLVRNTRTLVLSADNSAARKRGSRGASFFVIDRSIESVGILVRSLAVLAEQVHLRVC